MCCGRKNNCFFNLYSALSVFTAFAADGGNTRLFLGLYFHRHPPDGPHQNPIRPMHRIAVPPRPPPTHTGSVYMYMTVYIYILHAPSPGLMTVGGMGSIS